MGCINGCMVKSNLVISLVPQSNAGKTVCPISPLQKHTVRDRHCWKLYQLLQKRGEDYQKSFLYHKQPQVHLNFLKKSNKCRGVGSNQIMDGQSVYGESITDRYLIFCSLGLLKSVWASPPCPSSSCGYCTLEQLNVADFSGE